MRRHQAECLVPEEISRDCIKSIHISDDPDTYKQVKSWIDSSGLTINLKTMNKYQSNIDSE